MRYARRPGRSGADGERGALSLMIVILFLALVILAGFVADGGAKLAGEEYASSLAQEAARAGATSIDSSRAYSAGSFVVDRGQALQAVADYLASASQDRYSYTASASATAVEVTVTIREPTRFLSMIGLSSFSCTGTATASLVTGVTGGT
jgi:hypothetical protein